MNVMFLTPSENHTLQFPSIGNVTLANVQISIVGSTLAPLKNVVSLAARGNTLTCNV